MEYNVPIEVDVCKEKGIKMNVVMMDAGHIIGSSMFLFYGYFGSVLYTGDMRYHRRLLSANNFLFWPTGQLKMHVDELILDNTYCDPIFSFPSQERCVEIIREIIDNNQQLKNETLVEIVDGKMVERSIESPSKAAAQTDTVLHVDQHGRKYNFRVFIYCYTVGKEELCIDLARAYRTKIVLDAGRYRMIKMTNFFPEHFTTDPNEGFIHLTKGIHDPIIKHTEQAIHIRLTGWINTKSYMSLRKGNYSVAYSSHSNFPELDEFVSFVRPCIISNIVISDRSDNDMEVEGVNSLSGTFFLNSHIKQRGLQLLSKFTRRQV